MGWDLDVGAQAQEVAAIGFLILVTVGDDPHTPDGQHRLQGEQTSPEKLCNSTSNCNPLPDFQAEAETPDLKDQSNLLSLRAHAGSEDKQDIQRLRGSCFVHVFGPLKLLFF